MRIEHENCGLRSGFPSLWARLAAPSRSVMVVTDGSVQRQKDQTLISILLQKIVMFFKGIFAAMGTRRTHLQARGDALCEILYDPAIETQGLRAAWTRVTGATERMLFRGKELQELNADCEGGDAFGTVPRAKRKDYVDLEPVVWWFHNLSPDVEIDKSDKRRYKRKRVLVGGKLRDITCERRILLCSKQEAVQHYKESEHYKSWQRQDPTLDISDSQVQICICYCMKPKRGTRRIVCVCALMHFSNFVDAGTL